jgi:Sortase domain
VNRPAAWAALLVGAAMAVAPLVPGPPLPPVDVGSVPAPDSPGGGAFPAWTGLVPAVPPSAGGAPAGEPPVAAPPVRLHLAAIGVDAPVTPVDVDPDGALAIPADPAVVGWWRGGAEPGAPAGSVVLAGHVDTWSAGPGALFRLARLRPQDRVVVDTSAGPVGYVVDGVRQYPKTRLPAEAFATTGRPRLVLITCGGEFDARSRHYADNVVVYATPADPEASR